MKKNDTEKKINRSNDKVLYYNYDRCCFCKCYINATMEMIMRGEKSNSICKKCGQRYWRH